MKDYKNYSLKNHNTFGIEANCKRYIEYTSTEEVQQIVRSLTGEDRPLLILGGGSNLLLTGDYPGTVLHSGIRGIEVLPDNDALIRCGSGEVFDDFIGFAIEHHLYGAENLSLIPGETGASAVQNIGAYGAEAKDIIYEIEAVEIATGNVVTIKKEDCAYSYRQSKFKNVWRDKYIITHVTYQLSKTFAPKLDYGNIRASLEAKLGKSDENIEKGITPELLRSTIIDIRKNKLPDPEEYGNAGSFFMNPIVGEKQFLKLKTRHPDLRYFEVAKSGEPVSGSTIPPRLSSTEGGTYYKIPAGWLIDQCGWKGRMLGKAGVWPKQALVLYNAGGAEGKDIVRLCDAIRNDVKQKFDLDIYPEVNIK